ncbi:MAG: hypothetical protein H0W11_08805 [Gemmatimonadetes bacterium]|nr:hypothetical protein [Gemmatimonadota bacterium]
MSDPIHNRSSSSVRTAPPLAAVEAPALSRRMLRPDRAAVRAWILSHDDSWLFLGLYIGLAVVLSIWISLFWLVVVVAAHFALELVRQQQLHAGSYDGVVLEALWELKLDVALVLFALALTLYMEVVLGLVGLQAASRAGAATQVATRAAARVGAWERTLRGLLLSADDAAQIARAVAARRRRAGGAVSTAPHAPHPLPKQSTAVRHPRWGSWVGEWGTGDSIAMALALACIFLIAAAPWLTSHSYQTALAAMLIELRPMP